MFLWYSFQLLAFLVVIVPYSDSSSSTVCKKDHVFDFEDSRDTDCFQVITSSAGSKTLSTNKKTVKLGQKSLKWKATSNSPSSLRLDLSNAHKITTQWFRRGGVKVWFYKESASPGKSLSIKFKENAGSSQSICTFDASLNFQGWRGIWVKFTECIPPGTSIVPTKVILFTLSGADTIYIDLLEFKSELGKQSRDKIVPPIRGVDQYDASNTWQRTYHWSQQPVPPLPSRIDQEKTASFDVIKSRLKNWYLDETKTTPNFPSESFLKHRWDSLQGSIQQAHQYYDALTFESQKLVGPPLFCRNCRNKKKFGEVITKILLPLAVEYYLRSRTAEIDSTVLAELNNLNSANTSVKNTAYEAIAGGHQAMQKVFKDFLPTSSSLQADQVKATIKALNLHRLSKINSLLDFVKDQGFADGSGLGSLDHEMNRDGSGFSHTLFLISDSLSMATNKSRLEDLINTAKWYNEFGEVYQSPAFEYRGTTADRMITLCLFRILIVLTMPKDTDVEIKARIRDMEALVKWLDNSIAVNEGLGGVMKPDYTGHHHKAFYGSAYVPQALHNAALVQYLLHETEFSLSTTSVNNIRRGLETMRLMSAKYSTPNSVNGRFPNYFNKVLFKALPGYAYISVSNPPTSTVQLGITVTGVKGPEMFLRLYDESDPDMIEYLKGGRIKKSKYYFNTLGALDIMKKVQTTSASKTISAEPSPEGHWSKNYAVLSIHRRKDWVATAKGFTNFLWDFENKPNSENIYGMFASHGALLIANSEAILKVHDVENGWDWAKVPGTTTIALGDSNIDDLNIREARFYNKRELAGGLTFKGTYPLENGIFGMDFDQPNYEFDSTDWRGKIKFKFKKSFFFFENLIVSLGTHITATNTKNKIVQTTLFQDKLFSADSSSKIKVNGVDKTYSDTLSGNSAPSSSNSYITLTDTKGNFYYIPSSSQSMLRVHVKDQNSKTDDGKSNTSGRYGTAWFDHTSSPNNGKYEFAVLIPTSTYHATLTDLATAQNTAGNEVYEVLLNNRQGHVVKFLKSPRSWTSLTHSVTGYVLFREKFTLPAGGPIEEVNSKDLLIMVESTTDYIYLSISIPGLNLQTKKKYMRNSNDAQQEERYHSASEERKVEVKLREEVEKSVVYAQTHGDPDCYKPNVWVQDYTESGKSKSKLVQFLNLKNGFSVEVKLRKKIQ
ncbi:chondroitin sulfate ABC exolyase-like [Montipora foliosa]|uniref:chondroitin sulfate ABC exolyase-like n=1 Tax=Montipora foliosa TaxID=591990 RepID=UPI0035F1AB73